MARRGISRATERLVRERANARCEYCRCPEDFSTDTFAIEHIQPRVLGGSNSQSNLAFACPGCNGSKATRTEGFDSINEAIVPLFHPRQHSWTEHFRWSVNSLQVEGITSIGRATVETLRLNRSGVVNLRRILILDGKHPPDD